MTFCGPGVPLATFGAYQAQDLIFLLFFVHFWSELGASGVALEHHVDAIGCLSGATDHIFGVFLAPSAQNLIFHHFWVGKWKQKRCVSRRGRCGKT